MTKSKKKIKRNYPERKIYYDHDAERAVRVAIHDYVAPELYHYLIGRFRVALKQESTVEERDVEGFG